MDTPEQVQESYACIGLAVAAATMAITAAMPRVALICLSLSSKQHLKADSYPRLCDYFSPLAMRLLSGGNDFPVRSELSISNTPLANSQNIAAPDSKDGVTIVQLISIFPCNSSTETTIRVLELAKGDAWRKKVSLHSPRKINTEIASKISPEGFLHETRER